MTWGRRIVDHKNDNPLELQQKNNPEKSAMTTTNASCNYFEKRTIKITPIPLPQKGYLFTPTYIPISLHIF